METLYCTSGQRISDTLVLPFEFYIEKTLRWLKRHIIKATTVVIYLNHCTPNAEFEQMVYTDKVKDKASHRFK